MTVAFPRVWAVSRAIFPAAAFFCGGYSLSYTDFGVSIPLLWIKKKNYKTGAEIRYKSLLPKHGLRLRGDPK